MVGARGREEEAPVCPRQTYGKRVDVDDHEVQGHGEGHGSKQPEVAPWGHAHQGLVLRQAWKRRGKGILRVSGLSKNICVVFILCYFVF